MKRLTYLLVAAMVFGFAGTALADNSADMNDTLTTLRISTEPVAMYDAAGTGTTLYVATGDRQFEFTDPGTNTGVSIYAVDLVRTTATGTLQKKELTAALRAYLAGATIISAPMVADEWAGRAGSNASGTSLFFVAAAQDNAVGQFSGAAAGSRSTANTGLTIYALNGQTGAINWQRGVPMYGATRSNGADGGTTLFPASPLVMDTESITESGVSLYGGIAPLMTTNVTNSGGATVFYVSGETGAISGATEFPTGVASIRTGGVSAWVAAPAISGNSLYMFGWNGTLTGITFYGMDKKNLNSGVSAYGTVLPSGVGWSFMQIPAPVISGNSIYVVATTSAGIGGVTVYDKTSLAKEYTVAYGPVGAAGVSASPVTDGSFIVLSTTNAVTCYNLSRLSSNTAQWTIDLTKSPYNDGTYAIQGSPAISNGYVYIPAFDTTGANKGFVLRAQLNSTTGNAAKMGAITAGVKAGPIAFGDDLLAASYNPTVYQMANTGVRGEYSWEQFKADKARTGSNTRAAAAAAVGDDDDSGCFISIIK